jgi:HEPN domain-containing protein
MSIKTRKVEHGLYTNYLKKARESLEAATESLRAERWNAATIDAVHCGISSTDALTVFTIGVRHAGERHEDAIALLQTLNLPRDIITTKGRQLSRLIGIKSASEYSEKLINEKEASEAVRDAERYLKWVEELLQK